MKKSYVEVDTKDSLDKIASLEELNERNETDIKELRGRVTFLENQGKEEAEERYINKRMKEWRKGPWMILINLLIGTLAIFLEVLFSNKCSFSLTIAAFKTNPALNRYFPVLLSILNIYPLKILYDKYFNQSNINAFKESMRKEFDYFFKKRNL